MRNIIDGMGRLSAQAQHLRTPITDYGRLKAGSHTLYLCTTGVQGKPELVLAKGMLKVGRKNLFIRKDNGQLVEMSPLCVLDFYVHESCQRYRENVPIKLLPPNSRIWSKIHLHNKRSWKDFREHTACQRAKKELNLQHLQPCSLLKSRFDAAMTIELTKNTTGPGV